MSENEFFRIKYDLISKYSEHLSSYYTYSVYHVGLRDAFEKTALEFDSFEEMLDIVEHWTDWIKGEKK